MLRLLYTLTLVLAPTAFASDTCDGDLAGPIAKIVAASNHLGLNVLGAAFAEHPTKNTLISPLSLNLALHLGLAGAGGGTAAELADALGVPLAELPLYRKALDAMTTDLTDLPGGEQVAIANAAWADQATWRFKPSFLERTGARAFARDFRDPKTVTEMNAWGREHTRDKIKSFLDQIPPDVFFILTNALYFKAAWYRPFESPLTQPRDFATAADAVVSAPMMHMPLAYVPYYEDESVKAVTLRLAGLKKFEWGAERVPSRFTLDLLMPPSTDQLEAFVSVLDGIYPSVVAGFNETRGPVELAVPKFKLGYDRDLTADLVENGITKLFSEAESDLSEMGEGPRAHVTAVLQKMVAEMDEQGFEAAAVTSLMGGATSLPPTPKVRFLADRPYVFLLRDQKTGAVLFSGVVTDPTKE